MDISQPGFTRFTRFGENLGRLHVLGATHTEGLDGTDTLSIVCTEDVSKGDYIVWRDRSGIWHEHIVDETKRTHDDSGVPLTSATCINSINETWDDWIGDKRPSGTAQVALNSIMSGTRWSAGTCTQQGTASHTFYHKSVREGLQELLETWGGEMETAITVSSTRVTGREVRIVAARGDQNSPKRFTWSKDLVSISREVASDNPKSRLYAYGKGEETEAGGYGRRIGIEDVNPTGMPYVEDADATLVWGRPMPDGSILPAIGVFVDDQCEDPEVLLEKAYAALDAAKNPMVTYTGDVVDLVSFGRDWEDVGLGDLVAIIDTEFSDDGLRLRGRVSKLERDLLTDDTKVTFGTLYDAMVAPFQSMQEKLASLSLRAANWDLAGTASTEWLDTLIENLNAAYTQAGTYHYSSFEKGEIWSSVPLDADGKPTISGGWAMNINGYGFRLANSVTADGEWNWRAFGNGNGFTADEINAGALNAALITTGILAGTGFTLDLDTGVTALGNDATVGDRTVSDLLDDVDATIISVDVQYAQNQSASTAPTSGWSTTAPAWQAGYYIWQRTATTTPNGTSYSTPVMISGRDGTNGLDGTSVSILGSYNSLADLQTAHPTGSAGDGYLVGGDLYVWNGTAWEDVGTIQGPPGQNGQPGTNGQNGSQIWTATANPTSPNYTFALSALTGPSGVTPQVGDLIVRSYYRYTITSVGSTSVLAGTRTSIRGTPGADGRGISSTAISYGASSSSSTEPTTWQSTVPALSQGQWLWTRTVIAYTDSTSSTSYTKSYIGTDGDDGVSVYVQSATKSGKVTTVVLADSDGNTNTLTITDGENGQNGQPGAGGYVHTAWANSADGSEDFSTSVSTDKKYLGVYTDQAQADSTNPASYSWSLIKGLDGEDGTSITAIVEQYYLSTSDQTPTGGTWTYTQPEWVSGKYIWTRSEITWDDSTVTTTTPILASALNQANSEIAKQKAMVREYGDGVLVCRNNQSIGALLDADGGFSVVWVTWSWGVPTASTVYATFGVHASDPDNPIAFTLGSRAAGSDIGSYSFAAGAGLVASGAASCAFGGQTTASGTASHSEGSHTTASGNYSHAEGSQTTASGDYSHVEGDLSTASGDYSHAEGGPLGVLIDGQIVNVGTVASGDYSHAEGRMNKASGNSSHAEGGSSTASNVYAHAEGYGTVASGVSSHAEGSQTTASGNRSHAEGNQTTASGDNSHASGYDTKASSDNQTVIGKHNVEDTDNKYVFIIGNGSGTSDSEKRNALTVDWSGNLWIGGILPSIIATYQGSQYSEGGGTGWATALIDTLENSIGNCSSYFTVSSSIITAKKECTLAISAHLSWRDGATGNYGFDVYDGSTERSSFTTKGYGGNGWVSVDYPRRLFHLSKNEQLQLRRYRPANAGTYRADRSWVTIEVVG